MANLKSLIRYRTYQVDEKKKILGRLFEKLSELETQKKECHAAIERERNLLEQSEDIYASAAFDHFRKAMQGKIQSIERAIMDLEIKIEKAQEDLRERFAELKKAEITQKRRDDEEKKEALSKENTIMDEIGTDTFLRKTNEDKYS